MRRVLHCVGLIPLLPPCPIMLAVACIAEENAGTRPCYNIAPAGEARAIPVPPLWISNKRETVPLRKDRLLHVSYVDLPKP
jgi:hypothetical protein